MAKIHNRMYGAGHLHLIVCTCYQSQPKLGMEKHRDVFVRLLEEIRVKFRFAVAGDVVMPTEFHLLMTEPAIDTVANSVAVLQQRYRRRYNNSARSDEQVWSNAYSDIHVIGPERIEARLNLMHQQPVKAGLVPAATEWEWSSARFYADLPEGVVTVERVTAPQ